MHETSYKIFADDNHCHTIHHNIITGEVLKIGLLVNDTIYVCDDILEKKIGERDRGRVIYDSKTIGTVINGVTTWHEVKNGWTIFAADGTYHAKIKGKYKEVR